MNNATLVLGGTGKTGRRVVARLQAAGRTVRIGSRSAEPGFDWEDPSTWAPALAGVDYVYLSYYPDLAVPGAVEAVRAFTRLATDSGVRRVVLLSGRGEAEAQAAERVVQEIATEWTIVRCSWFMQNFSEDYLLEPLLAGEVALPVTDIREPFVDADDIADVAVAALTEDRHGGQLYELTGPRLLSFGEAVSEISAACGREIAFIPVSLEDYTSVLAAEGLPPELIEFLTFLFGEVLDGRNEHLSDGVQRALGRGPSDFADYAKEAAASGAWTPR